MYYALHSKYKINMSGELKRYHFMLYGILHIAVVGNSLLVCKNKKVTKHYGILKGNEKKNDKNNVLCSLDF